jgi:hypothetical protein
MKRIYFALFISGILASACSSTSIINSWKAPGESLSPSEYKKVMVVAYVKDEKGRESVENQLVKFNKVFYPSWKDFTSEQIMQDTAKLKNQVKAKGYDGVIIMRLITTRKKSTYVVGGVNPAYNQQIWYYNDYYKSGSYASDMEVIISTNIYSLTKDKLIWSGVTSSTNPKKVDKLINEVAKAISDKVREDKLVLEK